MRLDAPLPAKIKSDPPDGQPPRHWLAGRKVRSPQGSVPANGRGAALKGRLTESATENIPPCRLRAVAVRVKRCGKSAPRPEQSGRQGKPHVEQGQIGEDGVVRSATTPG